MQRALPVFLPQSIGDAVSSFTEVLCALAVIDLPFAPAGVQSVRNQEESMTLTVSTINKTRSDMNVQHMFTITWS